MDNKNKISKNEAIFFMDMVGSYKSPNHVPKLYKVKPYYKVVNERNSNDYKRFIGLYKSMRYILTERQKTVLNELYGVDKESSTLKAVADLLNISPERVRQIRNEAEYKVVGEILANLKDNAN